MGHLLLMWRLILRDLRRHPGEAVIFLLAVTTATASLAIGIASSDAVSVAYAKTRAATAGPDVMVSTTAEDPSGVAERLYRVPGVVAHCDPLFAFDTTIRVHGSPAHSAVEGRDGAPSAVDQPKVTSGTWVRHGGAVVERGFAKSLGVRVGDSITVGGRAVPVVGTAISAAISVYPYGDAAQGPGPSDRGGMVWLTTADARAAAGDASSVYLMYLKLSDPAATARFHDFASAPEIKGEDWVNYHFWQNVFRTDSTIVKFSRPALVIGGWLLAVAATVTLAALATARAAQDNRRAGLLKAVGAGPGTVAVVLLAQHLLLTTLATALGLTAGTLVAPRLVDPSDGLLNTVSPPATNTVVAVVVLAVVVALAGTVGPAVRAARNSTVHTLTDPAHLLTHHPRLTAMTAYLPTSLLLGVRLLARRPSRAVLTCAGTAATSLMVTAMLAFRADFGKLHAASGYISAQDILTGRTLLGVTIALLALSMLNTVLVGRSAAAQARHALTVARTLGATPGQVVTALCVAQFLPAVPGLAAGIPAGLGLYWFFSGPGMPPTAWLLTAALAMLLATSALTALPAWSHTRTPAGRALNTT